MPLRVVVQSPAHLVRQPVAHALAALGCAVFEVADVAEVVARLNEISPDLVVVDADAAPRQWRTLAAGLGVTRGRVGVVLLAGRVSFDDAHAAQALGVAGIIRKPFVGADHAMRLVDAALARRGLRARRAAPRCPLDGATDAILEVELPGGLARPALWNVSRTGAALALPGPEARDQLRLGEYLPSASLAWGDVRLELSLDVVHVTGAVAGVRFRAILDGEPRLARTIRDRLFRAVGPVEARHRW